MLGTWVSLLTFPALVVLCPARGQEQGQSQAERIVGGTPVPFGTYPYYGLSPPGNLCGCSLIHPNVAVSAGHCQNLFPGLSIYLGGILPDRSDAKEVVEILEERVHPLYNRFILDYDILVLRLSRPVTSLTPLAWNADPALPVDGDVLTVMGFGLTEYAGPRADELLQVEVPAVEQSMCEAVYDDITENMLCAGGELNEDSCTGDSGSPLIDENGIMVGIVSTGPSGGCGLEGLPGIYARASAGSSLFQQAICDWSTVGFPDYCETTTPLPTASPTTAAPSPAPPTLSPTETQLFNDACPTARFLGGSSYNGTTISAATSDTATLCGRGVDMDPNLLGVWFRVIGSGSIMSVDTCGVESQLFVYDGGSCSNLHCIHGTSGGCQESSGGALLEWSTVFQREYWILAQTSTPVNFTITTTRFVTGPPNIACFLPTTIGLGSMVAGTTLGGGPAPFMDMCGDLALDRFGVWYTFSEGNDAAVTADTCSSTSAIDTSIVVFQGECNDLQCVAGSDDGCDAGSPMSSVTWTAQAGVDYIVFVYGEIGDFVLRIESDDMVSGSSSPSFPSSTPTEATPSPDPTSSRRPSPASGMSPMPLPSVEPSSEATVRPSPVPASCSFFCMIWRFITSLGGLLS